MIKEEPNKDIIEKLISLFNKKNYLDALNLCNDILIDYPNSILVNNILGVIETELKNYTKAEKIFIKVVGLNPNYSDGYYNLGNIYNKLKEEEKAIESYEKVIKLDNNYYKAYNNLGNIYRKKNLNKKALDYYILSLSINSNYTKAYYNLSGVLQHIVLDEKNEHINKFYLYLLEKKIIVRPKAIATNVINGLYLNSDLRSNFSLIKSKLFPKNLNNIVMDLSKNSLFLQFMKVCPIPNYYFEINLKRIRLELLDQIYNFKYDKNYIKFLISLSAQCFLNEYVYSETEEEINKIKVIIKRIKKNINKVYDNFLEILIVSCYHPLHDFDWCKNIKPSNELLEIYKLQYVDYNEEKKQLLEIKSISNINDKVSIRVKDQYEENPYPRWTNLGLSFQPKDIKDIIKEINLKIEIKKINFAKNPEILIAGCGTGQHAITTASKYKNAKITALDLSFNSLAYARRKSEELGFKNINFIQGDLLDLKKLNKKFDIIESVGVLHHMADPFIGWKSLVDCAKNNSLMLIGLYSQKARKNISEIRRKINDLNIKTTRANIINFRKEMFENENPEWNSVQFSPDFYSTSGVRDLLFHIQEHTFTIPQIKDYLKSLKLVFLGFESTYVIEKYKKMYDQPQDLYDLDKWEVFENNNPRIFSGMYQFWCKRN
tara:strand:+ start:1622 stop:3598 length:1977 start_codon:yes stop_codon:yes gene_type:complete